MREIRTSGSERGWRREAPSYSTIAVLIVSHSIEQIKRLCKHVLWLKNRQGMHD